MNVTAKYWIEQSAVTRVSLNVRKYVVSVILFAAVLLSALSVVYVKEVHRGLMIKHQSLTARYQAARVNQGKLLLEQSAWGAQQRVRNVASKKLHMKRPDPAHSIRV